MCQELTNIDVAKKRIVFDVLLMSKMTFAVACSIDLGNGLMMLQNADVMCRNQCAEKDRRTDHWFHLENWNLLVLGFNFSSFAQRTLTTLLHYLQEYKQ